MLRVAISQIYNDDDGSTELLARFTVDSTGIHPEAGERVDVVATIPVVDPDSGRRLTSDEDPMRWAELLPQAIRSGDLAVLVEAVPAEYQAERVARDPITRMAVGAVESAPAAEPELAH